MKRTDFAQILKEKMGENKIQNFIYIIKNDAPCLKEYRCLNGIITLFGTDVRSNKDYTLFTELWQDLTPEYNEVFSHKNEAIEFIDNKSQEELLRKIDSFFAE